MPSTPPLPTECYLEILRYVTDSDALCHLSQANRQCRELALPLLYHSVFLTRERSVRQFCQTVENDSGLAGFVQSFSIASSASPKDEHRTYLERIHGALKSMVSLTELSIRLIEQPPYQQRHWIFEGTTFQLTRLELRMDYDSALISFLTGQPKLESLTLLGAVPDHLSSLRLELPSTALPRLSYFHGHYTQALALVPGRPVKSVHITQVDDSGEFEPSDVFVCLNDTVETIAQSTHIRYLEEITLDDEDGDYGLLEVVLCNIPTVKAVNLYVTRHGHSWRRYSTPQWPSYIQARVQDQPMRLERLNTSHDAYARELLLQLAPLPVLPIFETSRLPFQTPNPQLFAPASSLPFRTPSHPRAGFHNQVWHNQAQELVYEYTVQSWKRTFPVLGSLDFLGDSNRRVV
ncbi:hypothetical protein FRC12_023597 [Ceratobasidium sp. 428]|nr:hypothetical protein FRC12_023597 [Ceratobasidium sp. 428]